MRTTTTRVMLITCAPDFVCLLPKDNSFNTEGAVILPRKRRPTTGPDTSDDHFLNMIEPLYNINNLYASFLQVKKASGWKETTQRYEEDLLFRLTNLRKALVSGKYVPKPPHCFLYLERGKLRLIKSYSIDDRIVQGCFVNDVLLPVVRPKLIYDNSASLKLRGTDHFRKRLEMHVKDYAKVHGNNGYILLCDYRKYYDNIQHEKLYKVFEELGVDSDTSAFIRLIVDAHKVDVSYMDDAEYNNCMNVVYDAIKHFELDRTLLTGKKFMYKSMGIGSHIAQLAGIVYPYRMDNYIKIVQSIKGYGRYADDFYIIDESKDRLQELLGTVKQMSTDMGLFLNENKTQIVNLRHEFTILKTKYTLKDNGILLRKPDVSQFVRCKRKLKAMHAKVEAGKIDPCKPELLYKSTRGNLVRYGETPSIKSLDGFYNNLFNKEQNYGI